MYNSKFILENGKEIYPGYLDKEQRQALREQIGDKREVMRCGCKPNDKLFYRISEDLKIYPEHNNYKHDLYCSRYKTDTGVAERQTAYLINEEDGAVTAYVTFNPKNFDISSTEEVDQDNPPPEDDMEEDSQDEAIIEKEENSIKKEEKKEPKLSLPSLVRSINVDAFSEKVINNKKIDSKENFSKFVYYRMKKVKISKMKKPIGDLSLEKDGVRFIYVPFAGAIKKTERGLTKCYIQTKGSEEKIYNNLIFPETLEKAIKEFTKVYGIEPDDNTMIAGFQYYKKSRSKSMYRVLGRIHLFQISDLGIYCKGLVEQNTYNSICEITEKNQDIKFWIPPEDESIGGIIEIKNMKKKLMLLFRTKKDERIVFDTSIYEPLVIDQNVSITKEYLYTLLEEQPLERRG